MKKIFLFLLLSLSFFVSFAQTPKFTAIHNAQAIDWVHAVKFLGIPYGPVLTKNSDRDGPALFFLTADSVGFYYYNHIDDSWLKVGSDVVPEIVRDQISPGDTCVVIDSISPHIFQIRINENCLNSGGGGGSYSAGYGITISGSTLKADTSFGKVIYSRYQGKTALCFGDSYTYLRSYQSYLKNGLGVDTTSNGVSGSTITGVSSGTVSFVSRIDAALATNPDMIVIVTGGNDWSTSKPIGNFNSTDTTTFIGACRYIAAACAAKAYAIKTVVVTPIQRGTDRANYDAQKQYVDAMIYVFQSYGIPVIDAFSFSGISFENNAIYTSDGIHLNTAGIKKYGDFLVSSILANSSRNVILSADGGFNSMCGFRALSSLTSGANNNATGAYALGSTTTGSYNTAQGNQSLAGNTTGSHNTAAGHQALVNNTTGSYNTAVGRLALANNTTADYNTGIGYHSLYSNTTGFHNTGIGTNALELNTTGIQNSGFGMLALGVTTTGQQNSALGFNSLGSNTTGSYNAAFGRTAIYSNTTGANNTGVGYSAGYTNSTGSGNVFLGYTAGYFETGSNKLHIGNVSSRSLINGDFSTNTLNFSPLKMTTPSITGSGSGGSLPAGNYYYVITALFGSDESDKSTEVGYAASGTTSSISINWPAVRYATGYKIYRGSSSGTYTAYFSQVGTSYTETGGSGTAGSPAGAGNAYYIVVNKHADSSILSVNGRMTVYDKIDLKGNFYVHGSSDTSLSVTSDQVFVKSGTALRAYWATDDPYFEAVGGDVYLGIKSTARFHVNENLVNYTSSGGDVYLYLDKSNDEFYIKQNQQGAFGKRFDINAGRVKLGDVDAANSGGVIDIYPRDKEIYLKTAADGTGSAYLYADNVTAKSNGSVLGLIDHTTGKIGYLSSISLNTSGTAAGLSSTLATTSGGTGLTSYTTGDILYASATNTLSKLGIGTSGQALRISGGLPIWRDTLAVSGVYVSSLASIGSSANANGASISSGVLTLQPASASFGGVVTTGTQTFAGNKTFSGSLTTGAIDAGSNAITTTGNVSGNNGLFSTLVRSGSTSGFQVNSRSKWQSSADGMVEFTNAAGTANSTTMVFGGMRPTYAAKTTTYTITSTDYFVDCTSGTFTVTLPTAVGATGQEFVIKNSGAGTITIATTSAQTIDGASTKTLSVQYGGLRLNSDGSNWKITATF